MNSTQMLLHRQQHINTTISHNLLFSTLYGIIIILLLLAVQQQDLGVEAKQVSLLPLTAQNVYQLLNKNHHLDAVPEGRIVTQGIAAVTGFTLGLKKAVGATILYDIITANITEDSNPDAAKQPAYLTQEICFTARNARSLDEAEAIAEAYSRLEENNLSSKATVRKSGGKRKTKPKRNRRRKLKKFRKTPRPQRIKMLRPKPQTEIASSTMTMDPTTSAVVEDTANGATQTNEPTATATAGVDETNINNGLNTETTSTTTTSTDNDKTVTCIVLQKPKLK